MGGGGRDFGVPRDEQSVANEFGFWTDPLPRHGPNLSPAENVPRSKMNTPQLVLELFLANVTDVLMFLRFRSMMIGESPCRIAGSSRLLRTPLSTPVDLPPWL